MQKQQVQNTGRWLGIGLIVAAVLIVLVSLSPVGSGFYGHMGYGMHGYGMNRSGMDGHGMNGYGPYGIHDQMMGYGAMPRGLAGMRSMHPGSYLMRGAPMMPWLDFARSLDLTAEQQTRIAATRDRIDEQRWDVLEQLNGEQRKLFEILQADSVEPARAGAQFERVAALQRRLFELGLEERQAIEQILTAEQRDSLAGMRRAWGIAAGPF